MNNRQPEQDQPQTGDVAAQTSANSSPQDIAETHIPELETLSFAGTDDPNATKPFHSETTKAPVIARGLPTSIKGYEVLRELGRGGMGVVYLARQIQLKRLVALKVIRSVEGATDEDFERFAFEAESVAALQHPHIVQIFEIGEHEGGPFCALEYVDGGSLSAAMKQREFSPSQAASMLETLARAVHYAHQKSIIHRDLKPANVLLTADGMPKVSDFGLAKRLNIEDSGLTRTGVAIGTPAYMAPEQARGEIQRMGPAVDIYALGVILYELLARRLPFIGTSVIDTMQQVLNVDPPPLSSFGRAVPRDLETVCLKCLAKDPALRYSSALALAQDLERYSSGEPILARRETLWQKAWRKGRKRAAILVATAVAIVAIAMATYAFRASAFAQRVTQTERLINQGLDQADWTIEQLNQLDRFATQLAALDSSRGEIAQDKLIQRVSGHIRADLQRPRVTTQMLPAMQVKLDWIASKRPQLAKDLQQEVNRRVSDWQPVIDLVSPFTERSSVFADSDVQLADQQLRRNADRSDRIPTRISSRGRVRVRAKFGSEWKTSHAIGIALHHEPATGPSNPVAAKQYEFLLVASNPQSSSDLEDGAIDLAPEREVNFEQTGGRSELQLIRNKVVLQRRRLTIDAVDLQIVAERDGEQLMVQVNDAPAIRFTDVMPLAGSDSSVFELIWPNKVALEQIRIDSSLIPPTASPLEKADELFERGQFNDALALYQQQVRQGGEAKVESLCKVGLCAVALNRPNDATAAFESVIHSDEERWPAVAATQYWLMQLRAKNYQQADELSSMVSVRFTPEQLAQYVPAAVREELVRTNPIPRMNMLVPDSSLVPRLEALLRLGTLLSIDDAVHLIRNQLMVLHAINGNYQAAADEAKREIDFILDGIATNTHTGEALFYASRWYCWSERMLKQTQLASENLKYLTNNHPDLVDASSAQQQQMRAVFLPLQLEFARNAIDMQFWDDAENAVQRYLTEVNRPIVNYNFYSQPYLLIGFLQQRRGDQNAAIASWKQGLYTSFKNQFETANQPQGTVPTAMWGMIDFWIMASLSDSLNDQEAEQLWKIILANVSSDPIMIQFASAITVSPAVIRGVWRSDRGQAMAMQIASMSLPPVEYVRTPPRLLAYEKVRQELFSSSPSKEEDELIWNVVNGLISHYLSGEINKSQGLQLALAWKGTSGIFGWAGVAPALPKDIKAEVTYIMARRYLQLGQNDIAQTMFQSAMTDAPSGAAVRTLAEAALKD